MKVGIISVQINPEPHSHGGPMGFYIINFLLVEKLGTAVLPSQPDKPSVDFPVSSTITGTVNTTLYYSSLIHVSVGVCVCLVSLRGIIHPNVKRHFIHSS